MPGRNALVAVWMGFCGRWLFVEFIMGSWKSVLSLCKAYGCSSL